MNRILSFLSISIVALLGSCGKGSQEPNTGPFPSEIWLTTGDKSSLLKKQAHGLSFGEISGSLPTITIDTAQQFQSIDGFGYALTGGSAQVINQNVTDRHALLRELFQKDSTSIGISYLRISIGASDLDGHVFSYDDNGGTVDPTLANFSLTPDQANLIPVLKEILQLNPQLKIMASPWSAPQWMKSNNSAKGGSLNPTYYDAYANYFVKYIKGMKAEGITINAITIQNEPENGGNNPSMVMTATEQANFVKNSLGPALQSAGLTTKVIVFDHNCDHPNYPIAVLNDADAKKFVDGSAFHMYAGAIEALSQVHDAHPDRNVYFTEQWTSPQGDFAGDLRWHVKTLIIGATRNWGKTVLEWNLASDPNYNPHTPDGGCTQCLGALTIGTSVVRNVSYYIVAHASKFVPAGSIRIASNDLTNFPNVAFVTPEGKKVLIVMNDTEVSSTVAIQLNNKMATLTLPAGAVATAIW